MRWVRPSLLILLLSVFFLTSVTLAFDYVIQNREVTFGLETAAILKERAQKQAAEYKNRVSQVEAEISTKEAEIEAKKEELTKATDDLARKIQELQSANQKIKSQEAQLSANAKELTQLRDRPPLFTFSVTSSTITNIEQQKNDIKDLVTKAYPIIESVYSPAYALSSVSITFVDGFSNPNAAAETIISNNKNGLSITINIKSFDKNSFNDVSAIIHEIIHAFHGLAVLERSADEEGITVAATDAVLAKLIAQGIIPNFDPLYIRISESYYDATSYHLPRDNDIFYGSSNAAAYYQIAGYGWFQLYKADPKFFITFNEKIYDHKHRGDELTESLVRDVLIETVSGSIQGHSISSWLSTAGFKLY